MGLSRRKFTREMKLVAIRQLESGSSAAEVARAFETRLEAQRRRYIFSFSGC
jgi:transposase-like protein